MVQYGSDNRIGLLSPIDITVDSELSSQGRMSQTYVEFMYPEVDLGYTERNIWIYDPGDGQIVWEMNIGRRSRRFSFDHMRPDRTADFLHSELPKANMGMYFKQVNDWVYSTTVPQDIDTDKLLDFIESLSKKTSI